METCVPRYRARPSDACTPFTGVAEGDLTLSGLTPGTPASGPIAYHGNGNIQCLRASGNVAVVGYSFFIDTDFGSYSGDAGLVVEDNGATGDRYMTTSWSPISACPAPSASLFDTGTPHDGDFVVNDG